MTASGKTVVCTIHQPSSEVFAMFDRVLLLADGRTVFLGPIKEALDFFARLNYPCPANFNPADFFIFSLATVPGKEDESRARNRFICDAFDRSPAAQEIRDVLPKEKNLNISENQDILDKLKNEKRSPYKASWLQQFLAVFWRSLISFLRDPQIIIVKAASSVVSSKHLTFKSNSNSHVSFVGQHVVCFAPHSTHLLWANFGCRKCS